MRGAGVALLLTLAGCDALPRDPASTSSRVAQRGRFTVGVIDTVPTAILQRLAADVARRSGAQPRFVHRPAEMLVDQFERGEIDLAIGWFAKDSPWKAMIAFGPPLAIADGRELRAVMRNGENRWIMTVERASRAISPEARR